MDCYTVKQFMYVHPYYGHFLLQLDFSLRIFEIWIEIFSQTECIGWIMFRFCCPHVRNGRANVCGDGYCIPARVTVEK